MSLLTSPVATVAVVPADRPPDDQPSDPCARFVVGQDGRGFWVAVEVHGLGGGLFRTRHDALHYATDIAGRRPDAVVLSTAPVELRL